jgi:hypothetical protein
MLRFVIGLVLGAISGGLTYHFTTDTVLALIVGGVVAVLLWAFGEAWLVAFFD